MEVSGSRLYIQALLKLNNTPNMSMPSSFLSYREKFLVKENYNSDPKRIYGEEERCDRGLQLQGVLMLKFWVCGVLWCFCGGCCVWQSFCTRFNSHDSYRESEKVSFYHRSQKYLLVDLSEIWIRSLLEKGVLTSSIMHEPLHLLWKCKYHHYNLMQWTYFVVGGTEPARIYKCDSCLKNQHRWNTMYDPITPEN